MSEAAGIDRCTEPFGRASGVAVLGVRLRHLAAHGAAGSAVRVFALRVVGAALSYLSTLVLVRLLGPAEWDAEEAKRLVRAAIAGELPNQGG